ncbi:MAG: polymer-forming cytoskeletal protein [Gemmatimonadales bacterium]|jgi:cytoskeletal protein CcmA (bactofilin family)
MARFTSGSGGRSHDGSARGEANLSIIATGMRIVGELASDGVVKVEGSVEGTIKTEREVLVAKGGTIEGDLYTREAIIGGRVRGSIFADERVEVQQGSIVEGDISTKKLVVQEGGEVNGHVRMGDPKALEQGAAVPRQVETEGSPTPQATGSHA